MLRVFLICQLLLSGCGNIGFSVWSEDKYACPESQYDNGGTVRPMLGYCKGGRGFFVSYDRKIN